MQRQVEEKTPPRYIWCNTCYFVKEAIGPVNSPQDRMHDEKDSRRCPVCQKGSFDPLSLETTPEQVERSRAELEADRQRHREYDAAMLREPKHRIIIPSFDERLRRGFHIMEGRYDDG